VMRYLSPQWDYAPVQVRSGTARPPTSASQDQYEFELQTNTEFGPVRSRTTDWYDIRTSTAAGRVPVCHQSSTGLDQYNRTASQYGLGFPTSTAMNQRDLVILLSSFRIMTNVHKSDNIAYMNRTCK
jgi:hypothetical protein